MRIANMINPAPELIRFYRKLSGLSMQEICDRLHISYNSRDMIYDWEKGKHVPTNPSLSKLAAAFSCEVDDFYLFDVSVIRVLSKSVIVEYWNDPNGNKDRKARIAVRILKKYQHIEPTHSHDNTSGKPLDALLLEP